MLDCDAKHLRPYLIREALDDILTFDEQDFFQNSVWEIQNEFIVIGQRFGLDTCVEAIREVAQDFNTGHNKGVKDGTRNRNH